MPCQTYTDAEEVGLAYEEVNRLTILLCEACELLNKTGHWSASSELNEWWAEHRELDRRRKEDEARSERRETARLEGLSKLTNEEISALGLHKAAE